MVIHYYCEINAKKYGLKYIDLDITVVLLIIKAGEGYFT